VTRELKTYTKKERNMYLIGLYGQNVIYNIIGVGLMVYFTDAIKVPGYIVGTIMFIARLWDAINDYIMGAIVDKTNTRWGKCRPYLIFMPIPIFFITVLCFASPTSYAQNPTATVAWCTATYIMWGMMYTVSDIPLWGITARMTEVEQDRTNLVSLARLMGGAGAVIPLVGMVALAKGLVGKPLFNYTIDLRLGFLITALIMTLWGTVTFQLAGIGVREHVSVEVNKDRTMLSNLKMVFKNPPYMRVILSGIISSTKTMITVTSVYLLQWYFANGDPAKIATYTITIGGVVLLGGFASIAAVPFLTKKFEKKTLYNWSHIICIPPLLAAYALYLTLPEIVGTPYEYVIMLLLFIAGVATGAPMVLQTDMIGDSVNYLELQTGERAEGVSFAGQTFLAKFNTAVATLLGGFVLGIVNYTDHVDGMQAVADAGGIVRAEFPTIMNALWMITIILPAIGCLLAILPMIKYPLTRAINKEVAEKLVIMREKKNQEENPLEFEMW
jgi:sugar (glycoside-pentoside-hexuronide) transporter